MTKLPRISGAFASQLLANESSKSIRDSATTSYFAATTRPLKPFVPNHREFDTGTFRGIPRKSVLSPDESLALL